jgi:hypothetical protein
MNRKPNFDVGRGTPGYYRLNQTAPKFGDKRTKRNRDRSSQNRKSIDQSKRGE